jgi:hypothetical protein
LANSWSDAHETPPVAVEPFHLDRYVAEQVFRFNNRATKDNPLTDADRFVFLMSQVGGIRTRQRVHKYGLRTIIARRSVPKS